MWVGHSCPTKPRRRRGFSFACIAMLMWGQPPSAVRRAKLGSLTWSRGPGCRNGPFCSFLLVHSRIGKSTKTTFMGHRDAGASYGKIPLEAVVSPNVVGAKQVLMLGHDARSGPVAQPG